MALAEIAGSSRLGQVGSHCVAEQGRSIFKALEGGSIVVASVSRPYSSVYHARHRDGVIARIGDRGDRPTNRIQTARAIERENRLAAARFDLDAGDPRWQLAARTATQLQGTALPAEGRDGLLRLAHEFGLRPFEANMIIAIVQDEARLEAAGGQVTRMTDRLKSRLRIIPNREQVRHDEGARPRPMSLPAHRVGPSTDSTKQARNGLSIPVQIAGSIALATVLVLVMLGWLL